jgi:hypothetical protein
MANSPLAAQQAQASMNQLQNAGMGQSLTGGLIGGTVGQTFTLGNAFPQSVPYAPAPSWHDVVSLQQTVMQLQNQIFQLQERLNKIQDVKTWLTGPGDDKVAP